MDRHPDYEEDHPEILAKANSHIHLTADNYVNLSWENLRYDVIVENQARKNNPSAPKKVPKRILHGLSGTARGGRVLAVMGPSGAGKSTLNSALSGRLVVRCGEEFHGECKVNGFHLTNDFKRLFSVVAQEDITMGKETPRNALHFSARVRLGLSDYDATALTDEVLEVLSLKKCADTVIGVPGHIKGISGGEKKRVNIGCELITNPYIMILDEPTTGLDSVNAMRVGKLLQALAHEQGRTVICTIHTPSSQLYELFDDLLLLANGHTVFHGPINDACNYFSSIGYPVPPRINPSEFFMNLLQLPEDEIVNLYTEWENYRTSPEGMQNKSISPVLPQSISERETLKKKCKGGSTQMTQLYCLTARSFRMWLGDSSSTIGRLIVYIFLSLLIGLFFFKVRDDWSGVRDMTGVLYFISIDNVYAGAMPAIHAFPSERAIFLLEQRAEMYNPIWYVIAKAVAELPAVWGFTTVLVVITYFMVGFYMSASTFFVFLLLMLLSSTCSFAFGIFISTMFKKAEVSIIIGPLIILPMTIVAGLLANTERLDPYWTWLNYISIPRYLFSGILVNQFKSMPTLCPSSPEEGIGCLYRTGIEYIRTLGFDKWEWYFSLFGLTIMSIVFFSVAILCMTYQGMSIHSSFKFDEDSSELLGEFGDDSNSKNIIPVSFASSCDEKAVEIIKGEVDKVEEDAQK
eukprot:Tbor_TRINITY_DN5728_c0_g2::TRINITY_DN5728_c0_g2_i1::g.20010::m.20010